MSRIYIVKTKHSLTSEHVCALPHKPHVSLCPTKREQKWIFLSSLQLQFLSRAFQKHLFLRLNPRSSYDLQVPYSPSSNPKRHMEGKYNSSHTSIAVSCCNACPTDKRTVFNVSEPKMQPLCRSAASLLVNTISSAPTILLPAYVSMSHKYSSL